MDWSRLRVGFTQDQEVNYFWFMIRYVLPFFFITLSILDVPAVDGIRDYLIFLGWMILAFTPQIVGLIRKTRYNKSVIGQGIFLIIAGIAYTYFLFDKFVYFGITCLIIGIFFLYMSQRK